MNAFQGEILRFKEKIRQYAESGKKVFASSSFQTHSIPMLKLISEIDNNIPIYFLNTGFHFPETYTYRDQIAGLYNLRVINLESPIPKIRQKDSEGRLMFSSDPDQCCFLNKTLPMEPILGQYDVWITGVRKDQNENRRNFDYEVAGTHGVLRFHPMLYWTRQMIWAYIRENDIPRHPLENAGYISIGCEPCTSKYDFNNAAERDGRWSGLKKTECGLHTDLISK